MFRDEIEVFLDGRATGQVGCSRHVSMSLAYNIHSSVQAEVLRTSRETIGCALFFTLRLSNL